MFFFKADPSENKNDFDENQFDKESQEFKHSDKDLEELIGLNDDGNYFENIFLVFTVKK